MLKNTSKIILSSILVYLSLFMTEVGSTNDQTRCASNNERTVNYRRLAEVNSWIEPIVGIGEVTAEDAETVAHIRIDYDSCNRPTQLRYFQNGQLKPIDENFAFNRLTPTAVTRIEWSDTTAKYSFFDHTEHAQLVFGIIAQVVVHYDPSGRAQRVEMLNPAGTPKNSSFRYATVNWIWSGDATVTEQRYDDQGTQVRSGSEFPFASADLTLDERGAISSMTIKDNGDTVAFKRMKSGARKSWRFERDGQVALGTDRQIAGINYYYDKNHYLIRANYVGADEHPAVARSGHMGFSREYTATGNRLNYRFIDGENKTWLPPARGYAGQNFIWSENGMVRVRTEYVDASGSLLLHPSRGYAAIDHTFDDRLVESKRVHRDTEGQEVLVE